MSRGRSRLLHTLDVFEPRHAEPSLREGEPEGEPDLVRFTVEVWADDSVRSGPFLVSRKLFETRRREALIQLFGPARYWGL